MFAIPEKVSWLCIWLHYQMLKLVGCVCLQRLISALSRTDQAKCVKAWESP